MATEEATKMYAQWEEVEQRIYAEIESFLSEESWYDAERIAKGLASNVMMHLDGYTAEDIVAASAACSRNLLSMEDR